jgi:hypothetical protein
MSDPIDSPFLPATDERRAELRVPASTLGDVQTRLIGGSDFSLLNYTPHSLYGQSHSRLLVGARISVRLATATLNEIVTGRVVRASLTAVRDGVPCYEVAVSLEGAVDWSVDPMPDVESSPEFVADAEFVADEDAAAEDALADADAVPVPVRVPTE